jgi:hypothetical protein
MTSYRAIGRLSSVAAAAIAVLLAQLGVSQGLPTIPVCQGAPPTPVHNCKVNGTCFPHNACAGAALGAIREDSRTWCCKIVEGDRGPECVQYTAYWRCCQPLNEPPGWKAVCVEVGRSPGANCDGQFCN